MATKKAASTRKATANKPAAAKTTVRTVSADTKKPTTVSKVVVRPTSTASTAGVRKPLLPRNIINIVLAELFGTFILTLVALATFNETGPLYLGLAFTVLVLAIGTVSGAHINPAVTFGLWSVRRLKSILLPFYWGAQFLGAILAVVISNWVANSNIKLDFSQFWSLNWQIFGIELVGTAVFLFGFIAVKNRLDLSNLGKAFGIGLSLVIGLVVAGTIYTSTRAASVAAYQKQSTAQGASATPEIPHVVYVKGAVLNPAVSLAVTNSTKSELTTGAKTDAESSYSHLSLEVVLGTLVGAAVGANLYLLIAGRRND